MGAPAAPFGPAEVEWFFWGVAENYSTGVPQGAKLFHPRAFVSKPGGARPLWASTAHIPNGDSSDEYPERG